MTEVNNQGAFEPVGETLRKPLGKLPQNSSNESSTIFNWKSLAGEAPHYSPIMRQPTLEPVDLCFGQRRLWFVAQLESGSVAYNVPMGFRLSGSLNFQALLDAFHEVVRRHEALRTCYRERDGHPVQVVLSDHSFHLPVFNLTQVPACSRQSRLDQLVSEEIRRPFDLARDLMLRAALYRLAENENFLVVNVHHIACDGPSISILLGDLSALYETFDAGRSPDLPQPAVQCGDVARWQQQMLTADLRQKQLAYWTRQLHGAASVLELPSDYAAPAASGFRGGIEYRSLERGFTDDLRGFARRHGVTPFMTLLGGFQVLLYRLSGQSDITVGAAMTNREREEVARTIGYFSNMMPLRLDLASDPNFSAVIKSTRSAVLGAYAHRDIPFETIVAELQPDRTAGRNPFFQVIINFEEESWHALPLHGLESVESPVHQGTARFDLNLGIVDRPAGFRLALEYAADLFVPATARRMLALYEALLRSAIREPSMPVSRIPLLNSAAPEAVSVIRGLSRAYPHDICIHDLIETQVQASPDAVALHFGDEHVSYADLNSHANQLAHYLIKKGVGPDVPVGICLSRSPRMLVAILAVLKAGGAYVPLDPNHPAERRVEVLDLCDAPILITEEALMSEVLSDGLSIIPLDMVWPMIGLESTANPSRRCQPGSLAYIMHTSGSTGRPKGVPVEHHSIVNFLLAMRERPGMTASDVVLAGTTITFDPSVLELILPLTVGARIVLATSEQITDPRAMLDLMAQFDITIMQATPTSWKMLLAAGWQGTRGLTALCGGEILSRGLADQLLARCASLWNIYGPTETTVWSFVHQVHDDDRGSIPVGLPILNIEAYVLDRWLQPVPVGVAGELYIGGDGLARGYLHADELTAQSFVANPFAFDGSRLYRTGDLVRCRHDHELEFIARADRQIKIRGHRIEPGEIESTLSQHPDLEQVAIVPRHDASGALCLVAYVVPRAASNEPDDPALCMAAPPSVPVWRDFLRGKLPDYMVPAAFVELDALPRTLTGKLDWNALPEPDFSASTESFVAPRDAVEIRLAKIWCDTLKVPRVGLTDNFFDLGGHSVLGAALFASVHKEFGRRLPLSVLFQSPTLEQMADVLRDAAPAAPWLVTLQPGSPSRPPLFFVQARMGYLHLGAELGPDQPVYVVPYDNLFERSTDRSLAEIAAELAAKIREVQPRGPYHLGGICLAGWIAFSIAAELRRQGEEVALLAIFDSFSPLHFAARTRGTRLRALAGHFGWHLQNFARASWDDKLAYAADRLRTLRWHIANRVWWKAHAFFRILGRPLPKSLRHSARLTARAALSSGPAQPYPGRITLFRPSDRPKGPHDDACLGWQHIALEGVDLCEVPGDHKHLLLPPNVHAVAQHLRACLERQAVAENDRMPVSA